LTGRPGREPAPQREPGHMQEASGNGAEVDEQGRRFERAARTLGARVDEETLKELIRRVARGTRRSPRDG
jgi:hypothetical protein